MSFIKTVHFFFNLQFKTMQRISDSSCSKSSFDSFFLERLCGRFTRFPYIVQNKNCKCFMLWYILNLFKTRHPSNGVQNSPGILSTPKSKDPSLPQSKIAKNSKTLFFGCGDGLFIFDPEYQTAKMAKSHLRICVGVGRGSSFIILSSKLLKWRSPILSGRDMGFLFLSQSPKLVKSKSRIFFWSFFWGEGEACWIF